MDAFDPAIQVNAVYLWKPLISLVIFTGVGAFFFGALFTAITKGIKNEGWFTFKKKDNDA
tara:strand:- start:5514 stop:5693 length:180 start_codon:yes stop_codon:yes gene_type:complete